MKNPFSRHQKNRPWTNIAHKLHLRKKDHHQKIIQTMLQALLYLAIFLAGYLTANLQTLLS